MFNVGDKAKGFKFDRDSYPSIGWDDDMDDVVGVVGKVNYIVGDSYSVHFEESDTYWGYPCDLWYLGRVEEPQPFNVGDKVIPSFQIGDRVKFKKSSIDSGMIDATEDDVFVVESCHKEHWGYLVKLFGMISTVNVNHLEYVKESAMNNTEEQEIKWEVGQEVFCILRGKGVVTEVLSCTDYPVEVKFADTFDRYTLGGKIYTDHKGRVLFFSEPKIEAEKFPPKKLFVPAFQKGDVVAVKWADTVQILILEQETERQVKGNCGQVWDKDPDVHFYKLGEEVKFN